MTRSRASGESTSSVSMDLLRSNDSPDGGQCRSTESAKSVDPAGGVGPPKCRGRSTESPKSVHRPHPCRSTETPESVYRKCQGGRETTLPLPFGFPVSPPIYNRRRENREYGFPIRFSQWEISGNTKGNSNILIIRQNIAKVGKRFSQPRVGKPPCPT